MILSPWHISVLIPARNEETLLPRCLDSVIASLGALPRSFSSDIVVAVDRSTDATFEIATRMLQGLGAVVRTDAGCVGQTRKLAAKTALQRYAGPLHRCWLANTDADCSVPKEWLLSQSTLANAGFEVVAGIVDVDSFVEHQTHVPQRFRETYVLHADGTHPHVHGANFGIRADKYLHADGWGILATAEDHDLWNRLKKISARTISPSSLSVLTSGRKVGRAPSGFADALASHNVVNA